MTAVQNTSVLFRFIVRKGIMFVWDGSVPLSPLTVYMCARAVSVGLAQRAGLELLAGGPLSDPAQQARLSRSRSLSPPSC